MSESNTPEEPESLSSKVAKDLSEDELRQMGLAGIALRRLSKNEYQVLLPEKGDKKPFITYSNPTLLGNIYCRAVSNPQKTEADALAKRLESLNSDISELKSQTDETLRREDLEGIIEELKQARDQAEDISNNVIMPADLNLRLVRADLLDRLDEYRSQEGPIFLMLGLFGGAASAIVVNWITGGTSARTDASIVTLCILSALCIYFGYRVFDTSRRANRMKKQMLEED